MFKEQVGRYILPISGWVVAVFFKASDKTHKLNNNNKCETDLLNFSEHLINNCGQNNVRK